MTLDDSQHIPLGKDMIDLWLVKPDEIASQPLLAAYDQLMSESERKKQQRFSSAKSRHDALITRAFVRTVLSKYAPLAQPVLPAQWLFTSTNKGKPEIANAPIPLLFNLSHTQGLIVCAVALTIDIGVDVEYLPRKNATMKIAEHKFSATEIAELKSQPEANQHRRFFDYWTLKESYIKAVGDGLSIPLDQFSFDIVDEHTIGLFIDQRRNDDASQWQSWLLQGSVDHRIALSIKDSRRQPFQLRYFQTVPLVSSEEVSLPLV
ncbi:MAG: 4'-phosphopantetheinyl transferase [Phenylobacterium sp.]|jgi:4'-phosphopantetheinyl transferase